MSRFRRFVFLCLCGLLPTPGLLAQNPAGPLPDLIFENDFDIGDTRFWNEVDPPVLPGCNCYFSGDCPSGLRCSYGTGGPSVRDNCTFRLPKPGGVVGRGCNLDTPNPGPICDGLCVPIADGSLFATERQQRVARAISLWAEAMLKPAEQGGGPVDPVAAARARGLPFDSPLVADTLGRHVADVLMLTASPGFYDAFCHFEHNMEDPEFFVDLSASPCHSQAAWLAVRGLVGVVEGDASKLDELDRLKLICPQWQHMFSQRCPAGPGALECVKSQLRETATYFKTLTAEAPPPTRGS